MKDLRFVTHVPPPSLKHPSFLSILDEKQHKQNKTKNCSANENNFSIQDPTCPEMKKNESLAYRRVPHSGGK